MKARAKATRVAAGGIKLPKKGDVKFLVAEDIRIEAAGRFTLLGLFVGERFLVAGPPKVIPGMAFALPSLGFLFIIDKGAGRVPGRLVITAPDKKTVVGDSLIEAIEMTSGLHSALANVSRPFIGPSFGTYTVRLEVGTAKFAFPLTVEKTPESRAK
jgi:hypothetical protein